jgi:hypothetical protein
MSLVLVLGLLLAGCSTAGGFTKNDRMAFVGVRELDIVTLPVRIRWTAHQMPKRVVQFAVFVDRMPPAPERTLRSLTDDACQRQPGCPDVSYLAERHIYIEGSRDAIIESVPILSGITARAAMPVHQVTVVPIDAHERRVGALAAQIFVRVRP